MIVKYKSGSLTFGTTIRDNNLPYHYAYDLGMPRLSCCFCIFSPADALLLAGHHNPALLERYVEVEQKIKHSFKKDFDIQKIKEQMLYGHGAPDKVNDWRM